MAELPASSKVAALLHEAMESGDVRELGEAIAAAHTHFTDQAATKRVSTSRHPRGNTRRPWQPTPSKGQYTVSVESVARLTSKARAMLADHLSQCEAYLPPLRSAQQSGSADALRRALQNIYLDAPARVRHYMAQDIHSAEILVRELTAVGNEGDRVLRNSNTVDDPTLLDDFLIRHASKLSDETVLRLIRQRESLLLRSNLGKLPTNRRCSAAASRSSATQRHNSSHLSADYAAGMEEAVMRATKQLYSAVETSINTSADAEENVVCAPSWPLMDICESVLGSLTGEEEQRRGMLTGEEHRQRVALQKEEMLSLVADRRRGCPTDIDSRLENYVQSLGELLQLDVLLEEPRRPATATSVAPAVAVHDTHSAPADGYVHFSIPPLLQSTFTGCEANNVSPGRLRATPDVSPIAVPRPAMMELDGEDNDDSSMSSENTANQIALALEMDASRYTSSPKNAWQRAPMPAEVRHAPVRRIGVNGHAKPRLATTTASSVVTASTKPTKRGPLHEASRRGAQRKPDTLATPAELPSSTVIAPVDPRRIAARLRAVLHEEEISRKDCEVTEDFDRSVFILPARDRIDFLRSRELLPTASYPVGMMGR